MALIVETGEGLSNADSYISIADADVYVDSYADDATAWNSTDDAAKERMLKRATQYIDLNYSSRFVGNKCLSTQALVFPRYKVYFDSYLVPHNTVHQNIKQATVEIALRYLAGDDLLGKQSAGSNIASETKKIGSLAKSVEYVGGKNQRAIYPKINALLRQFLTSSNTLSRG